MTSNDLINIAKLRVAVGFLGEAHQYAWWACSFFHNSSSAFLTPIFGKTSFMAKYYGVKEAASIVHDEHIGVGKGVFHLFRLPEMIEKQLHELLENADTIKELEKIVVDREMAKNFLVNFASKNASPGVGPIRIGDALSIQELSKWQTVADFYCKAFETTSKIFPYFSEAK